MLTFYDFGAAGPGGDVLVAVRGFATGTATGSFDYTAAPLAGVTPKSVLAFAGRQAVADEPNETAHAYVGMFGSDGTNYGGFRTFSEDASTDTDTKSVHYEIASSRYTVWNNTGISNFTTATLTPISGGINLNYATNSVNQRQFYMAFAGADLSSAVAIRNLGTGTSALTVTVGFAADAVIFYGAGIISADSVNSRWTHTLGFALADGTQRCILGAEADAVADGAPLQSILTDRCAGRLNEATGALSYSVTAGNFTSTGFDVTPSASAGSGRLFCLALKTGPRRVAVREFTTRTATGSQAITGVGFMPQFALLFLSSVATSYAAGSHPATLTTSDDMAGMSICAIGDEQWVNAIRIDSGAATSDTGTMVRNTALVLLAAAGGVAVEAALTSFDSDGMTLNYTSADGTAHKGVILFIE